MGLFNIFKKEKLPTGDYTIVISSIYKTRDNESVVIGKVAGEIAQVFDKVKINTQKGNTLLSEVSALEIRRKQVKQAENGEIVAVLLKDITNEQIEIGDKIVSITD